MDKILSQTPHKKSCHFYRKYTPGKIFCSSIAVLTSGISWYFARPERSEGQKNNSNFLPNKNHTKIYFPPKQQSISCSFFAHFWLIIFLIFLPFTHKTIRVGKWEIGSRNGTRRGGGGGRGTREETPQSVAIDPAATWGRAIPATTGSSCPTAIYIQFHVPISRIMKICFSQK